jgi:DNA-binding NtrC family response regulator
MSESSRVLVIDDEESIRRTILVTLQRAGYNVDIHLDESCMISCLLADDSMV